jgi:CheY-like chemotaxis protein
MPRVSSSDARRVHSEQVSLEVALLASASPAEASPLVVLVVASDADVRAYVTDSLRQRTALDVVATGSVPSALDAAARRTPRMLVVAHAERAVLRHLPAVPAVLLSDDSATDVTDPRRLAPLVLLGGSFRIQRLLEATASLLGGSGPV